MEQFRYYGKGRYFAVTNKYAQEVGIYGLAVADLENYQDPTGIGYCKDGDFAGGRHQMYHPSEGSWIAETRDFDPKNEAELEIDQYEKVSDESKQKWKPYEKEREAPNETTVDTSREPRREPHAVPLTEHRRAPSLEPQREPWRDLSLGKPREPRRDPPPEPSRELRKDPPVDPVRGSRRDPPLETLRGPEIDPSPGSLRGSRREPPLEPSREPKIDLYPGSSREPKRGPLPDFSRGAHRDLSHGPAREPRREPPGMEPKRDPSRMPSNELLLDQTHVTKDSEPKLEHNLVDSKKKYHDDHENSKKDGERYHGIKYGAQKFEYLEDVQYGRMKMPVYNQGNDDARRFGENQLEEIEYDDKNAEKVDGCEGRNNHKDEGPARPVNVPQIYANDRPARPVNVPQIYANDRPARPVDLPHIYTNDGPPRPMNLPQIYTNDGPARPVNTPHIHADKDGSGNDSESSGRLTADKLEHGNDYKDEEYKEKGSKFDKDMTGEERYDDHRKQMEDRKTARSIDEETRARDVGQLYAAHKVYDVEESRSLDESYRHKGYDENQLQKDFKPADSPVYEKYKDVEPTTEIEDPNMVNLKASIDNAYPEYDGYGNPQNCYDIDVDNLDAEIHTEEHVSNVEEKFIEEEIIHEEFRETQHEPIGIEQLELDEDEDVRESDWPPPPEEKLNGQQSEKFQGEDENLQEHFVDDAKKFDAKGTEENSIYTSFLTIDVTSGKRDSLDTPNLAGSKHRGSLLNLVTGSCELEQGEPSTELDKDDMDKIRHDVDMITKYLHNMPLGATYWPQNYDVLRDLVKLYLASKSTSTTALNYLLDYFLKLNWPDLFLKCARRILKSYPQVFLHSSDQKIPFEDPTPETLDMTQVSLEYAVAVIFQVILSLAAEFTEVHEPSKENGHRGFIAFVFQELLPKLHGIPWGQTTAREEFLHSSIDILYNYSQSMCNIPCFYECNAIDILINLRKETDFIGGNRVNIGALLTLSFLIDDRNNHLIFVDSAPISLLIHYVEESLSKIDHCYADFSLTELIDGLTRIASHDHNKLTICSHGALNAVSKVLYKSNDDEELIAVCRLLWCLCFVEKCKQRIIRRSPEIIQIIHDLQTCKNRTLQQLAESVLWELEEKYSDLSQSAKFEVQHVFLSYHAESRDIMMRIGDYLTDKGYKVWLEKSRGESYSKHLTESIENSAVVVIAISRKYKQSPSVFAEADYAFRLCKPMIPVTVERNFKPDGWLGMLVGSKVWLDFTEDSKFEGHMQMLTRQLGEKGKSEQVANNVSVDGKASAERQLEASGNRLIDVSRWGNEEVLDWLQQNNLKSCVAEDKAKKLRGPHLLRLHHLRRESPDFYYNSLEPQLGFTDVIDMMEFTQALETLTDLQ